MLQLFSFRLSKCSRFLKRAPPSFPLPFVRFNWLQRTQFSGPIAPARPTNVPNRTYLLNEVHYYRATTTVHTRDYRRHYLPYERLGPASRSRVAATWYYSRFAFWPKSSFSPQCSLSSPSFPPRLPQPISSRSRLLVCIRITYSPEQEYSLAVPPFHS